MRLFYTVLPTSDVITGCTVTPGLC